MQGFSQDTFNELNFNLKTIGSDLKTLDRDYRYLYESDCNSQQVSSIISLLENGLLEHILTYHISESLRIIGEVSSNSLILEESNLFASYEVEIEPDKIFGKNLDDSQIKTPDEIEINLKLIYPYINSIFEQFSLLFEQKITKLQVTTKLEEDLSKISEKLVEIAEEIVNEIHPKILEVYIQLNQLYYKLNPQIAKEDEEWNILYTPLREQIHPFARSLDICLNCGAVLTNEDRTFIGSYCKNCRTRWDEPG
jgi:hypothetical protein